MTNLEPILVGLGISAVVVVLAGFLIAAIAVAIWLVKPDVPSPSKDTVFGGKFDKAET